MNSLKKIIYCSCFCYLLNSFSSFSAELKKVNLPEEDYVLFSLLLNEKTVSNSIDTFIINEQLFVSLEPLLSTLKVRYKINETTLAIWKNDIINEYIFSEQNHINPTKIDTLLWGDDGFYAYIPASLLSDIFSVEFTYDTRTLQVNMTTKDYLFPFQIIQQQNALRHKDQINSLYARSQGGENKTKKIDITIPDQYRLATMPVGTLNASMDVDKNNAKYNIQSSLVADFLYHSTILNIQKSDNNKLTGGLSLSKYKTTPEDKILGFFDSYSFGDISSRGSATSLSKAGLGFQVNKMERGARSQNTAITLSEYAPPGWEAELFHNNRFLSTIKVPDSGLLLYTDLDVFYGRNEFVIKLYGPFGEEDQIKRIYQLTSNALKSGDISYSAYVIDPLSSVFNTDDDHSLNFSHIGGNIDYGVNDRWQIGLSYTHRTIDDDLESITNDELIQDALTVKNSVSFPGMLFENDFSLNDNGGYLQKSSVLGNALFNGNYNFSYSSSENYQREGASKITEDYHRLNLSYNNNINNIAVNTFLRYEKEKHGDLWAVNNRLSTVFDGLYVSNSLTYTSNNSTLLDEEYNSLTGAFSLAGNLYKGLRISSSLNYNPEDSDFILKNSSVNLNYHLNDYWGLLHNISMSFRPLQDNNKWSLNHNLAVNYDQFRLGMRSSYQDGGNWSINASLQLFFGYDYYNNRAILNSQLYRDSAQLNLHAYLDRHINGVYDPLDYNLEGVSILGMNRAEAFSTGINGRTIIPGVPVNSTFNFNGEWKDGTQMIRNNYVLYTHPGARVDVNMPFYLMTEFSGFVSILRRDEEISGKNLTVDLLGAEGSLVASTKTDSDGYYEFNNLIPDNYTIRINAKSLEENELTSDVVGFNLLSSSIGGYTELPSIFLEKSNEKLKEKIIKVFLDEEELEPLVWDNDKNTMNNAFNMPTKNKIKVNPNLMSETENIKAIGSINSKKISADKTKQLVEMTENKLVQLASKKPLSATLTSPGFTLQFAAYSSAIEAEKFKSILEEKLGVSLLVKENKNSKEQIFYAIQFGGYSSKKLAEDAVSQLGINDSQYMIKKVNLIIEAEVTDTPIVTPLTSEVDPVPMDSKVIFQNGWVIQYGAYKTLETLRANAIVTDDKLYMAQKMLNNVMYYCLISENFISKAEAKIALKENNGWILPSLTYINVQAY